MNFLVVVSVPFTTKIWLLLKGEARENAEVCIKCLTLRAVRASLGLPSPLSSSESTSSPPFLQRDRVKEENAFFDSLLLFSELAFQVTTQWQPLCSEASLLVF